MSHDGAISAHRRRRPIEDALRKSTSSGESRRMSRGRPPGDYGLSPGHDPAGDRWQDDDSWMSEDTDGNGPAWPYSQQGLGRSGYRGASEGRGSGGSVTGDWQNWQSPPQPPSPP